MSLRRSTTACIVLRLRLGRRRGLLLQQYLPPQLPLRLQLGVFPLLLLHSLGDAALDAVEPGRLGQVRMLLVVAAVDAHGQRDRLVGE